MRINKFGLVLVVGVALLLVGCTTAQQSTAVGTGAGAGLGAIIGHQSGHTAEGALIGAGVGALGGYIYGNEKEKADERRERTQQGQYEYRYR